MNLDHSLIRVYSCKVKWLLYYRADDYIMFKNEGIYNFVPLGGAWELPHGFTKR